MATAKAAIISRDCSDLTLNGDVVDGGLTITSYVSGVLAASVIVLLANVAYAHHDDPGCWGPAGAERHCVDMMVYGTASDAAGQEPLDDPRIFELAAQIRRALQHAPRATCELKLYQAGSMLVCQ